MSGGRGTSLSVSFTLCFCWVFWVFFLDLVSVAAAAVVQHERWLRVHAALSAEDAAIARETAYLEALLADTVPLAAALDTVLADCQVCLFVYMCVCVFLRRRSPPR
jgi:hypothetical protein